MTRVLVIDDSPTVRMYHRQILEAGGFAVEEAADGVAALESALRRRPALCIVDVNMPKMDGYSLVRLLRGDPATRAVPIIMITTESSPRERKRALDCGADSFLVKPVQPADLLRESRVWTGRG